MKGNLLEEIKRHILIGDGAMGTYLYQIGFPVGISYEELNLTKPEVIEDVHRRYYQAGARFIETNTFSANREKLSKYGLEREVAAINRRGVEIARKAVGGDAYVAGAIGSIRAGKRKNVRTSQIKHDFQEQIEALLDAGIDGFVLETFYDLEEMLIAVRLIRKMSEIPLICQFAVEDIGRTQDGFALSEAYDRLRHEGADVLGLNCRTGPNGIMRAMETLPPSRPFPLSVFPNAGIPDYVDGRYTYVATPAYFAESSVQFARLGARIVGGCCGTTPEHIQAMAAALSGVAPDGPEEPDGAAGRARSSARAAVSNSPQAKPGLEPVPDLEGASGAAERKKSLVDLVKQRHTVIVELDPPRDLDVRRFMKGCEALKEAGVDAITMADNSLAVTRMSNMALGSLIREKLDVRPLVHIACRDRNLIGTQSHLMGLDALGIDHLLAVTGDPARFGDLPGSSSVYDLTSFEIIRMIKQLNEGISFSGKPLKQKADFVVGGAFNPNVRNFNKAVERLERKVKSGADYIMTQPIYDHRLVEQLYESTKHLGIPIFIGVMPLASGRNAEYLHNEVPGIQLSDEVRARMSGLEGEEGRRMGVRIAEELLDTVMKYFHGIYLITPFLLFEMSVALTKYVWGKSNPHLYPLTK